MLVELYLGTTFENLIEIHKKIKFSPQEERIIGIEKVLFEYLQELQGVEFSRETVGTILQNDDFKEYLKRHLKEKMDSYKTEQHGHQTDKLIHEALNKSKYYEINTDL